MILTVAQTLSLLEEALCNSSSKADMRETISDAIDSLTHIQQNYLLLRRDTIIETQGEKS